MNTTTNLPCFSSHKRQSNALNKLPMLLFWGGLVIYAGSEQPVNAAVNTIQTPAQARLLGLESLRKAVRHDGGVPLPEHLDDFVQDRRAAVQLGKALFWDMQVGSDGTQACASCHFHAGADNRSTNPLNPGTFSFAKDRYDDVFGYYFAELIPDHHFESKPPNGTLTRADFPFVKTIQSLVQAADGSLRPGIGNSNDISSSMGLFNTLFEGIQPGVAEELGALQLDPVWNINGLTSVRRVPIRNSPSVINAVFNYTNFWEGRANPHFNGQNAFGDQDANAAIVVNTASGLAFQAISIGMASLASQAVSPLPSPIEMSYVSTQTNVRGLPDIGKKVLAAKLDTGIPMVPLAKQLVHPNDYLLRDLSKAPYQGLATSYAALIKKAFKPQYWETAETIDFPNTSYSAMEYNFGLFFGLAVTLYESTLVADQSPFDQWLETGWLNEGFGKKELAGLNLFANEGQCLKCHSGPELTSASVRATNNQQNVIKVMAMTKGNALYDNGFYNISVTPTTDDPGRGDKDPFTTPNSPFPNPKPLAFSRQALFSRSDTISNYYPITFPILGNETIPARNQDTGASVCNDSNGDGFCNSNESIIPAYRRVAVDGAFKTPGLRNVELTGPYFHNGGMATLKQVVQFYNRGGNFCQTNSDDIALSIKPLRLTEEQEEQLVAFLVSLTDPRVRFQKAPFDHPELKVPANGLDKIGTLRIREVGKQGSYRPLSTYLNLDPQDAIYTPTGQCLKSD